MSAELARGGPGLPRAELRLAEGGGGGLNAAPPTPERGWREGCVTAAAAAAPQVNGGRAPATGGASSRGTPRGSLGLRAGRRPLGQVAREAESGVPPQGHRANAGRVPGVTGPSPPPLRAQVCRPGPRGA